MRYGFLYERRQEMNLDTKMEAYKLLRNPIVYNNVKFPEYEMLTDDVIKEDITNYSDYDVFWELVCRLKDDASFYQNQAYRNYGATEVYLDPDLIDFKWNGTRWKIFLTYDRLLNEYPVEYDYMVFYDDDQKIEDIEMYPTLMYFVNNLGKDNKYTGVKKYGYQDAVKYQPFYVFYYGKEPSMETCRLAVREHLVMKFGYDEAKKRFPALFVDSYRKIYPVYDNKGYPINYDLMRNFVAKYGIFYPEIILLLDWTVPIVVENGLSDVLPNFTPIIENDADSNKFIYFLSKVLNYLEGKVLSPLFVTEAQFRETDEYAAFIYGGIEWQVMKMKKTK